MPKTLIIAEKPSVARDIASALTPKVGKSGDFFENDAYIITSAVGHLVELYMPQDYDKKFGRWTLANLPIIPEKFGLKAIEKSEKQFNLVKKLLKRKDVETIINACDAGREGELIFSYLYELSECKKPFKRLWMQSMTPDAIREAFKNLREPGQMEPLQQAARSRSEADWLIGINGTRAITSRLYGARLKELATVGRVQTPTMVMVLERELAIRNFKPTPFWRITGKFGITKGEYEGVFHSPTREATANKTSSGEKIEKNPDERPDRIWNEAEAKALLEKINSLKDKWDVTETLKRAEMAAPRLYDLTTLQREANNRFGFPAAMTLKIAQALYERHKVLTYPRTDSTALPEDYIPTVTRTLGRLEGEIAPFAEKVLSNHWVRPNKRIFNNANISDHFAIIPTGESSSTMKPEEAKIYDMVCRRFVAIFFPSAQIDNTTRITSHPLPPPHGRGDNAGLRPATLSANGASPAGHGAAAPNSSPLPEGGAGGGRIVFKTEGKVLVDPGWMAVHGRANLESEPLVALSPADQNKAEPKGAELHAEATKPPARFTEATLLGAMESAGKMVEDDELADAMKERGLGTPATRANIIDHIINTGYIVRERRELIPTPKAESLYDFLKVLGADALMRPDLTGEWEFRLRQIEEKKLDRETFMKGIAEQARAIVESAKNFEEAKEASTPTDVISPTDQKPIVEKTRFFESQDGKIKIWKVYGGRRFSIDEIRTLVTTGIVGPLEGFISKFKRKFTAKIKLDENYVAKYEFDGTRVAVKIEDLLKGEKMGRCPVCDKDDVFVYAHENGYACQNSVGEKPTCGFKMPKMLLTQELSPEQMKKLLGAAGEPDKRETDPLSGFVSKKSGKKFTAILYLRKNGQLGWKFPPRPKKVKFPKGAAAPKDESKPGDDAEVKVE